MGKAADFIEKRFGVKTRPIFNPVTNTADPDKPRILKANPDRLAWTVVNLSANAVYIAWTKDVSSEYGIQLDTFGGSASCLLEEDMELVTYEVYAYAASSSRIFVVETEAI